MSNWKKIKKITKIDDDTLEVVFSGFDRSNFMKLLEIVRSLPGARFNKTKKTWTIYNSKENIEILKLYGFDAIGLNSLKKVDKINYKSIYIDKNKLSDQLFFYQIDGVKFLEANKGNAIIGDEMGLGKTIQAASWLNLNKDKLKYGIIFCPVSVKYNWKKEIIQWTSFVKKDIHVVEGGKDPDIKKLFNIIIINFDIVKNYVEFFKSKKIDFIIIDECHYLKNPKALRTKNTLKIAKRANYKIVMSGTPIINKPIEFYTVLNLLKPQIFNNYWNYGRRYCNGEMNYWGAWDFSGASNIDELHDLVSNFMIRRLKKDVLKDLPDKIRSIIEIHLKPSQISEYEKAFEDIIEYIFNTEGIEKAVKASYAESLVKFEKLKQLLWEYKQDFIFDWIESFIASGKKLVLFANHRIVLDNIKEKFNNISVKVDGSVTGKNREKAVNDFQNNEDIKLFLGNIKAAGIGLTLTAADSCGFIELPWTPGELVQAEDRIHRIGQKNNVICYYFIVKNSIEKDILDLLIKKEKIVTSVLDGVDINETQENTLYSLLKKFEKKF